MSTQKVVYDEKKWPYVKKDGKTWNVRKAESRVGFVHQLCKLHEFGIFDTIYNTDNKNMSQEYIDLLENAVYEMKQILEDKHNTYGYHINHLTSGKMEYTVVLSKDSDSEDIDREVEFEDFETLEQAEAFAENRDDVDTILESPTEEYFLVVNNETDKAFDMMYPTLIRALTFMYGAIYPKHFMKLCEYFESHVDDNEDTEDSETENGDE